MLKQGFYHLSNSLSLPLSKFVRLALITACIVTTITWYMGYEPGLALLSAFTGTFLAIRGWKYLKQVPSPAAESNARTALGFDLAVLATGGLCLFALIQYLSFGVSLLTSPRPDFLHLLYGFGALLLASPLGMLIHRLKP